MQKDQGKNQGLLSDINVVPLVDVMLVLLIIFMVTAPMMVQGVDVNVPDTTSKYIKTEDEPLILSIRSEKEIFIERTKIKLQHLETKLKKIFENRRNKELVLKADENLSYGFVMQVVARVKNAGIHKLGLVTEPIK